MKLTIAAIASTIAAIFFSIGYAGRFGCTIYRHKPSAIQIECWTAELNRGGTAVWYLDTNDIVMSASYPYKLYWTEWQGEFGAPDIRSSVFEFDEHSTSFGPRRAYLFAFPIWCVLLPSLIAPLLWWRKRRRPVPAAFEVITPDRSECGCPADRQEFR
jgi:hypothetical protein